LRALHLLQVHWLKLRRSLQRRRSVIIRVLVVRKGQIRQLEEVLVALLERLADGLPHEGSQVPQFPLL
jgi:hypothetical protein